LDSITLPSPFKGLNPWEVGFVISQKFQTIFSKKFKFIDNGLLSLTTAGPNNSVSQLGGPQDAIALRESSLLNSFKVLSNYFGNSVEHLLSKEIEATQGIKDEG